MSPNVPGRLKWTLKAAPLREDAVEVGLMPPEAAPAACRQDGLRASKRRLHVMANIAVCAASKPNLNGRGAFKGHLGGAPSEIHLINLFDRAK
jgi:hypothetical protein